MDHKLGEPISDDSGDENSQIRGLDEEKGIYHNPEVFASPRYEDDEPAQGEQYYPPDARPHPPGHESPDTFGEAPLEEELQASGEHEESFLPLDEFSTPADYPKGPPPAYEEGPTARQPASIPPLVAPAAAAASAAAASSAMAPVSSPGAPAPTRKTPTTLTGMLLGNIARPFEKMAMGVRVHSDDDDDDDDYDDMDMPVNLAKSKFETEKYHFTDAEIEVLEMMDEYQPEEFQFDIQLKPFLLDYQPAVGDVDTFVKIPRPDEVEDNVGMVQLDEPALKQSDPTILDMQLRNSSKEANVKYEAAVKKVERADKNTPLIEKWIEDIKEMHRTKPSTNVHYTKPLPDIERLMQEWPAEFEESLTGTMLPNAQLDVDLPVFVDVCLNLVDIPVHKSRIQSLHLLFSLYSEFKNSQHFRNLAQNADTSAFKDNTDRLEL